MSYTITQDVTLEVHECGKCGTAFAAPVAFFRARREDGESFYCPNGHGRVFRKTESQRLREQLERQQSYARHLEDQRGATQRSNAALRGVITRTKKRAAAGVCPCCQRTFQNVARHMAGQHPDYAVSKDPA